MLRWLSVGQDIHSSRDGAHIPPCSHLLHSSCYRDMLSQGLYACPTCGLAMQEKCSLYQRLKFSFQCWCQFNLLILFKREASWLTLKVSIASQDMSRAWRNIDREVQSTPMPRWGLIELNTHFKQTKFQGVCWLVQGDLMSWLQQEDPGCLSHCWHEVWWGGVWQLQHRNGCRSLA